MPNIVKIAVFRVPAQDDAGGKDVVKRRQEEPTLKMMLPYIVN